jgi:hypothetical protein
LLHPRENIEFYRELYNGTDISVLQNIEKIDYAKYKLAIGHYSTALIYPIFFKIPLWILDYENINSQTTSVFRELNTYHDIDLINYEEFIKLFIGTENCSFENVANTIELAIN